MFNLNEFIKRIFGSKSEYSSYDDSERYPKVVYENNQIKKEILEWVKYLGGRSFSQVLLDIGFKSDDVVYLYDKNNNLEYYYSVGEDVRDNSKYIKLAYGVFLDRGATIDVWNGNEYRDYEFKDNNFNNDKKCFMLSISEKKISDNITYKRIFYSVMAAYVIKTKDYEFIFNLGNYSAEDDYKSMVLDNEDKLEEYLCSLVFPVDIIDVYKNIISICNIDVSKYAYFEIKSVPLGAYFIGDILELNNGEFGEIRITRDNKRICLFKNNFWSCEYMDKDGYSEFEVTCCNGKINYDLSGEDNGQIDEYTNTLLEYDIKARNEVDDVKKLVRTMFNKKIGE